MVWRIWYKVNESIQFRGKGGMIRSMRKDELVISKIGVQKAAGSSFVSCGEVLGRKAWRVDAIGLKAIQKLVGLLNDKHVSPLEALEEMERTFETFEGSK